MNIITQKEDDFTQFLIDNYPEETAMRTYLIGFGYTVKKAEEKTRETQEWMMDEAVMDRYGIERDEIKYMED